MQRKIAKITSDLALSIDLTYTIVITIFYCTWDYSDLLTDVRIVFTKKQQSVIGSGVISQYMFSRATHYYILRSI